MIVYGLTGGIGMGKSTAADCLRARGVPVIDTDVLARQILEPGQPALAEIRQAFGDHFVGADGRLRRDELSRLVFSNALARQKLEGITHPRIHALWTKQVEAWRADDRPRVVIVIPLLFETGAEVELDTTVCAACSAPTQRRRLSERGWTANQIEQRLAAQWPIERKMAKADIVVWTESGLEILARQLEHAVP